MHASKLSSLALVALLGGCASHDASGGNEPDIDEAAKLRAAIASVELLEDCPDPEPTADSDREERAKSSVPKDSSELEGQGRSGSGCTQSTLQISLAHDAAQAQRVDVVAVRLLRADTKQSLTTLRTRKPSKWNGEGVYQPWDQLVPSGGTIQVSYRLAEPDWNAVENALRDRSSFDQPYLVEVDLVMAGETTTVRSTELARLQLHVMET